MKPESSSPHPNSGDNVVQGHLVTLKAKDGREKLFFLDPSGSLLPILPAEITPAEMQIVKVSTNFYVIPQLWSWTPSKIQ